MLIRRRLAIAGALLTSAALSGCRTKVPPFEHSVVDLSFVDGGQARGTDAAPAMAPADDATADGGSACGSEVEDLARIDCAYSCIRLHPPPTSPKLGRTALRQLDAVALLMHRHPEILLLRIEATVPEGRAHSRRQAMQIAQSWADRAFRHLWRGKGISAERLEPVGLAQEQAAPSLHLRISQWARGAAPD